MCGKQQRFALRKAPPLPLSGDSGECSTLTRLPHLPHGEVVLNRPLAASTKSGLTFSPQFNKGDCPRQPKSESDKFDRFVIPEAVHDEVVAMLSEETRHLSRLPELRVANRRYLEFPGHKAHRTIAGRGSCAILEWVDGV